MSRNQYIIYFVFLICCITLSLSSILTTAEVTPVNELISKMTINIAPGVNIASGLEADLSWTWKKGVSSGQGQIFSLYARPALDQTGSTYTISACPSPSDIDFLTMESQLVIPAIYLGNATIYSTTSSIVFPAMYWKHFCLYAQTEFSSTL